MTPTLDDPLVVVRAVTSAFTNLSISYFVVGSVASGVRGEFRATNDIDIVCRLDPSTGRKLTDSMKGEFFVDLVDVSECIRNGSSFNVVHRQSAFKVDVFTRIGPLEEAEFARNTPPLQLSEDVSVQIASAEYLILAKLRWWDMSHGVLDRQIRDARSVVSANRDTLDVDFLEQWGSQLGTNVNAKLLEILTEQ